MFTLQEISFIKLSKVEREQLPDCVRTNILSSFISRIIKTWKKSKQYKLFFLQKLFINGNILTKKSIIRLLSNHLYDEETTFYEFISFLHNYYHDNNNNKPLSDNQMINILLILKRDVPNNSHDFFRHIFAICHRATELILIESDISGVLMVLDKESLINMYTSLLK